MTKQFLTTAALSVALMLGTACVSVYAAGITVGAGTAGSAAAATIGTGAGPLATVDSNGNPVSGGSQTNGTVNLGTLLAGIDLSGVGGGTGGVSGGGGGGGGGAGLSLHDRQLLKTRCGAVLISPATYQSDVVKLCQLIAKM